MISGISEPARSRHSTLYLWMRRNHTAISQQIEANGVHWADFTAALVAEGLLDRTGKPPSISTAQKTWSRVRKEVAARPAPKPKPVPSLAPGEIAPGVRLVPPPPPIVMPAAVPAPPVHTPPASEPASSTDRLEELRREMNIRSGRKPDA